MSTNHKFDKTFLFRLLIDDVERAAFQKIDGMESTVGSVVIPEGGRLVDIEEPGKVKHKALTMTRGVTDDFDLYGLWQKTFDAVNGVGGTEGSIVPNAFDIVQLDRDCVTPLKRWRVEPNFWNVYGLSDWDAGKEEAVVEKIGCSVNRWYAVPING